MGVSRNDMTRFRLQDTRKNEGKWVPPFGDFNPRRLVSSATFSWRDCSVVVSPTFFLYHHGFPHTTVEQPKMNHGNLMGPPPQCQLKFQANSLPYDQGVWNPSLSRKPERTGWLFLGVWCGIGGRVGTLTRKKTNMEFGNPPWIMVRISYCQMGIFQLRRPTPLRFIYKARPFQRGLYILITIGSGPTLHVPLEVLVKGHDQWSVGYFTPMNPPFIGEITN